MTEITLGASAAPSSKATLPQRTREAFQVARSIDELAAHVEALIPALLQRPGDLPLRDRTMAMALKYFEGSRLGAANLADARIFAVQLIDLVLRLRPTRDASESADPRIELAA